MFIFFGWNNSKAKEHLLLSSCPHCSSHEESLIYSIRQSYFHVFWIPIFPTRKKTSLSCDACAYEFPKKEYTAAIQEEVDDMKKRYKRPLWTWSGILLLATLLLLATGISIFQDRNTKAFLNDPQIGDEYFTKPMSGLYTSEQIERIEGDIITLRKGNYAAETDYKLKKTQIKMSPFYSRETHKKTKSELLQQYEQGKIYQILRGKLE